MGRADAVKNPSTTKKAKRHVQERPKKVSSKKPWPAISEFLIFQLPSVAVTLALLALYIRNFTWNPDPGQLSALLFAARVHEGLIVASLSQILYHHTRRALLGPRGIPFGFVTASFQLNSPFYMLSSGFWAPLINLRGTRGRRPPASDILYSVAFGALLVACFLLAALAGASSGVVMLPVLGWYEMPLDHPAMLLRNETTYSRQNITAELNNEAAWTIYPYGYTTFIVLPAESLYPSVVDLTGVSKQCHEQFDDWENNMWACPAASWLQTSSLAYQWMDSDWDLSREANITVGAVISPLDGTHVQRASYKDWSQDTIDSERAPFDIVTATCPLQPAWQAVQVDAPAWPGASTWTSKRNNTTPPPGMRYPVKLAVKISDSDGKTLPLKQPKVVIQCSDHNQFYRDRDSIGYDVYHWHFSRAFYPEFNLTIPREPLLSMTSKDNHTTFGFLDHAELLKSSLPRDFAVSAAFWIRTITDRLDGDVYDARYNYDTRLCLVDARWVESEVWTMPLDLATTVQHTVALSDNSSMVYTSGSNQEIIDLTLPWLNVLNSSVSSTLVSSLFPNYNVTGNKTNDIFTNLTSVFNIIDYKSQSQKDDSFHLIPSAIAVLITDALSHLPYAHGWSFTTRANFPSVAGHETWDIADWNPKTYTKSGEILKEANSKRNPMAVDNEVVNRSNENTTLGDLDKMGMKYARMDVAYWHLVYGYGPLSADMSVALVLSWTVLLAHLVIVLGHVIIVVVIHRGWTSEAWTQFGELLTLAMGSRRPGVATTGERDPGLDLLRNTGAGVDRWRIWRLWAYVREFPILSSPGSIEDVDDRERGTAGKDRVGKRDGGKVELVLGAEEDDGGVRRRTALGRITEADKRYS
ncbi:hypothetical protein V8F33_011678 [Rhypophila sp. PSN 637]